jgi:hypothetical protein
MDARQIKGDMISRQGASAWRPSTPAPIDRQAKPCRDMPAGHSASGFIADVGPFSTMSPLAKRIVFSWIATDVIWGSLLIYVLKREKGLRTGL